MIKKTIIIVTVLLVKISIGAQSKFKIPGQAPEYPLYTEIDTADLNQYANAFSFPLKSIDKIIELRFFLMRYVIKQDPLADFLYAKTFDLYPYGYGDSISANTALQFYHKAANQNYARAESFLYSAYKNGFLTLSENDSIAYTYLIRFIRHGGTSLKALGYRNLASIYYRGDFYNLKADTLKTIEYLEKSLQYDSTDTWTLDFLGGLYEDRRDYEKAIYYNLRSDNDQSRLQVANWLIKGVHVEKDFERGLAILLEELRKNPGDWGMRLYNAIEMINRLYCEKKISREQLGYFHKQGYCD